MILLNPSLSNGEVDRPARLLSASALAVEIPRDEVLAVRQFDASESYLPSLPEVHGCVQYESRLTWSSPLRAQDKAYQGPTTRKVCHRPAQHASGATWVRNQQCEGPILGHTDCG
jgi:hypothetical protein